MGRKYTSPIHIFSIADITVKFNGSTLFDRPDLIDLKGDVIPPDTDSQGNLLYGVDSEFGFNVSDFIGAEQKEINYDFAEGQAGNIEDEAGEVVGISIRNAPTDIFKSGFPLGTWSLALGGQSPVKASTEHYITMANLLSDQLYPGEPLPGDPVPLNPLDNDLRLRDLSDTGEPGLLHDFYVKELSEALQRAIDNNEEETNPQNYTDIDFDRDGTNDPFTTLSVTIDFDENGDGVPEEVMVGGIDLDDDGEADVQDSPLNGLGGTADLVDLLEPNESSVLRDIAYGQDYSVTLKDDGKLLYRWGNGVKRPNDIRMEVKLELPEEWTKDDNGNDIPDILEGDHPGFVVTRAELEINHDVTNNPNDQIRPEDYENEGAIGRLPSYYIVKDPDNSDNILWVSVVDTYNNLGEFLPSYLKLTETGEVDLGASGIPVFNPEDELVGYRNTDEEDNPIGTILRDMALAEANAGAGLNFTSADLEAGFTVDWYTTTDREPFEWSYDKFSDDPYRQVFESFRSREEGETAGYTEEDLASGPRWRLTPNKFGQDLPGLEVPVIPNSPPPFKQDNIKYPTGETTTTYLNLLDWEAGEESPFGNSMGWMLVDPERLDEDRNGIIDEGWSKVNGEFGAGDEVPDGPIYSAVTPNGVNLSPEYLDTAVYVKGDRRDSAKVFDVTLHLEYESDATSEVIGTVQEVTSLNHLGLTVTYEDGNVFDNPVAFAMPPTTVGPQTASVTFEEVTSSSATLFVDKPDYLSASHQRLSVSLLTLEQGKWFLADGTKVEVGTVDVEAGPTDVAQTVNFDHEFDDVPIVLAQLQTNNDVEWTVVRTDNASTTGFDFYVQKEEANDSGLLAAEVLGYAAIDASNSSGLIDWNGIQAQTFEFPDAVDHRGATFVFDPSVGLNPLISAGFSSKNGSDPITLRHKPGNDGVAAFAEFIAQEEQSADDEVAHTTEDVTGIAFAEAGLLTGEMAVVDGFELA